VGMSETQAPSPTSASDNVSAAVLRSIVRILAPHRMLARSGSPRVAGGG
jgi:hypothetical protein